MEAFALLAVMAFIVAWLALGVGLFARSNELLSAFCAAYPEEARSRIPHAFSRMRHPRKVLYFLSSESQRFLEERSDAALLSKRTSMVRLLSAFLSLHFAAMLLLAVAFFLSKR